MHPLYQHQKEPNKATPLNKNGQGTFLGLKLKHRKCAKQITVGLFSQCTIVKVWRHIKLVCIS